MLTRWINVRPRPIAIGAKPWRCARVGRAEDDDQEHHRHHDLGHEPGQQRVAARRVHAVAVRGKARGHVEARFAAGDEIQHAARHEGASHLREDVGRQLRGRESPAGPEARRHRRVQVAPRDVPDGIGHRQHRQPERERHAERARYRHREMPPPAPRCHTRPGRARTSRRTPRDTCAYVSLSTATTNADHGHTAPTGGASRGRGSMMACGAARV